MEKEKVEAAPLDIKENPNNNKETLLTQHHTHQGNNIKLDEEIFS